MKLVNRMINKFDNLPYEKTIVFSKTMEPRPLTEKSNNHQYYYPGDILVTCKRGVFKKNELDVLVASEEAGWVRVRPTVRADWLQNLPSIYLDWLENMSNSEPLNVIPSYPLNIVVEENMLYNFFYELPSDIIDMLALNLNNQVIQCNQIPNDKIASKLINACYNKKRIYSYTHSMINGMFEGVNNTPVVEQFKKQLFDKAFKMADISQYVWHRSSKLPTVMSIAAYECNHDDVMFRRYNELCLIHKDGRVEFLSLRALIESLDLDNVEYVSVPVNIPSDVDRVINVIYGTHIVDGKTTGVKWKLYKR